MIIQSIAGLLVFTGLAWSMSENRRQVRLKIAIVGIIIQLVVGLILLKLPIFREFFLFLPFQNDHDYYHDYDKQQDKDEEPIRAKFV